MANNFQANNQVPKNALSNTKIRLVAKNNVGKLATMSFKLKKNNPQIHVYTNEPNDTDNYGRIDAALDTIVFNAYLEMLETAAKSSSFKKQSIKNRNYIFPNGKRSEQPVVVSELLVGRDEDGVVWTSVIAKGRPAIKFKFIMPEFHQLIDHDGNPTSLGDASKYVTLGFIRALRDIMNHLQVTEYVETTTERKSSNNKSNNNSSEQKSNKQYEHQDDDIPW